MIGRLLHLGGAGGPNAPLQHHAAASHPVSSLDSVQEDMHTRNLLFPDPETLPQNRGDQVLPLSSIPLATPFPGAAPAFDTNDDIDLDAHDVRVLVMQDALGHTNASLLFDSHPAPPPAPIPSSPPSQSDRAQAAAYDSRRNPVPARKPSVGQHSRPFPPDSPLPSRQGAFDRRGSMHGRTQSYKETEAQKAAREYRDELATFSSCIFGNSELMAYKGTSTKVHVVPSEARTTDHPASFIGDGRGSIGRSSTRSSKLSQSFTSQTFSPNTFSTNTTSSSRAPAKKKVLITRLFPVNLPNDDRDSNPAHPSHFTDDNTGYPFPSYGDEAPSKKRPSPTQRRTPMYAVVLVVQLPASRLSAGMTTRSAFRESGSYSDQDVFSSSYGSARPQWWGAGGSGMYGEPAESAFSADVEDRIDYLTQHWDIIMRTLTHLQSIVATTLGSMLKQVDESSTDPFATPVPGNVPPRNQLQSERRSVEIPRVKPSKSTVRLISLSPNCLSSDTNVMSEANLARRRIVTGLKAARVVTGQGRWGIWRDEAIWASRWSRSLDGSVFLNTLLTGFLAAHTDWLQALVSPSLRRRYLSTRQHREGEDLSLPARTVIVSEDKMAARRLIFLLTAFMPANQHLPATRPHRPSTSASVGGFTAHSPPSYIVPVLREESLRRKINRRTGNRRTSHSRNTSQSTRTSAVPTQLAHLSMERSHERRVSDASSIRPSASLALPGQDWASRKSSAATTATILPETTMPHFSSMQRIDADRNLRPDSSGSLATDDLKRSLQRGESSSHASTPSTDSRSQSSKWGSVISGFWTPRRRDSTSLTSPGQLSDIRSPIKPSPIRRDKLSEMVQEVASMAPAPASGHPGASVIAPRDVESIAPDERVEGPRPSLGHAERPADGGLGTFDSPVKTSFNEDDGVIDVDFPFPDYITSFESAISSPSSSGYLSTPGVAGGGLESFENSARTSTDGDPPINAAGWLTRFHPDFSLQAIAPQEDLLEQVKATLRAEPTPTDVASHGSRGETSQHWVDVGCVVIADTTTSSVRRITHRRLVRPRQPVGENPGSGNTSGSHSTNAPHTPSVLPYEDHLGEEFLDDVVTKADDILAEALDRVVGFRTENAKEGPLTRIVPRAEGESDHTVSLQQEPNANTLEAPRAQCKAIILSALEELIREVTDHRDGSFETDRTDHENSILQEAVRGWVSRLDAA